MMQHFSYYIHTLSIKAAYPLKRRGVVRRGTARTRYNQTKKSGLIPRDIKFETFTLFFELVIIQKG